MLPKVRLIQQHLPATPALADAGHSARESMRALSIDPGRIRGKTIGIAVGSRGLDHLPDLVRAIVDYVREMGGSPFVFAAIGTQGGGTAEGHAAMLASLGITEGAIGAPVRCCGENNYLGKTPVHGYDVYYNRLVDEMDGLIVLNRIKYHTDFNDITESGVIKMFAIGIGNPRGAQAVHTKALRDGHGTVIREVAGEMIRHFPVLFGVMTTENWRGEIDHVEAVTPDRFVERESELLRGVKAHAAKFPVDTFDSLIVAEMGKNISGTGMDTKTIGRIMILGQPEPEKPKIARISVLGLTEHTHGNYMGIGLADYTTMAVFRQMDIEDTCFNCVLASAPEQGRIPVVTANDRAAVEAAVGTAGLDDPSQADLIYIRNTSCLETIAVSEPLYQKIKDRPGITPLSEPQELEFDQEGRLLSFRREFGMA